MCEKRSEKRKLDMHIMHNGDLFKEPPAIAEVLASKRKDDFSPECSGGPAEDIRHRTIKSILMLVSTSRAGKHN